MNTEKTIFVFYTLKNNGKWKYPKLPKGWQWIGSGKTAPIKGTIKDNKLKYENEEQFCGPLKTHSETKDLLNKIFTKLKKDKIIKIYKIRNSYLP